jgi:hypothetical protein
MFLFPVQSFLNWCWVYFFLALPHCHRFHQRRRRLECLWIWPCQWLWRFLWLWCQSRGRVRGPCDCYWSRVKMRVGVALSHDPRCDVCPWSSHALNACWGDTFVDTFLSLSLSLSLSRSLSLALSLLLSLSLSHIHTHAATVTLRLSISSHSFPFLPPSHLVFVCGMHSFFLCDLFFRVAWCVRFSIQPRQFAQAPYLDLG